MAPPALPPIYRVKIPCSDEREFRERFAPKYVADGIFVPSVDPKPVGTRLRIKLELRTGVVLVMGDAMVTSRVAPGGSDKPGMTLRITALHPDSLQFELSPAGAPRVSPAPTPRATPPPPPARSPVPPPAAAAAITPPP
ncbi:MAG TPA: hypothetical protein VLT47_12690, partial [Anaeromyxobacteraceae bacterium]|nr:hypothetical protein [Anaeromyxobacteraceae bacterium]